MQEKTKWMYATDEEGPWYHACEGTEKDAVIEAFEQSDPEVESILVGPLEEALCMSEFICVETWLDEVIDQDDYRWEGAEEYLKFSLEQEKELEDSLKKTIKKWMVKNKIKPPMIVRNWQQFERSETEL